MACVRKEIIINANLEHVWAALADFHAVHKRVAPGFVTDSQPDGEARVVKFSNGTSARELLVDRDAKLRRLVYAVAGSERLKHHNASVQVFAETGGKSRLVWIADFLPSEIAPYIDAQMEEASAIMRRALAEQS
jgi:hypothetical protein